MAFPDLLTVLYSWWGSSYEGVQADGWVITAQGNNYGGNPPYGYADLLALYPKWFGQPVAAQITTTIGSTVATLSAAVAGLADGDLLVANGVLTPSTTVGVVNGTALTLSQPALATATAQAMLIFPNPLVPYSVISIYLVLAQASISFALFDADWSTAVANYIAHFLTLWCQSEGDPQSTQGAAAQAGLARGIAVSKNVDGVNVTYKPWTDALDGWGAFQGTTYGAQLITAARSHNFPIAYYQ
jgi:hypothetical protein